MSDIKIDTEVKGIPGTCCEQVVGDKIIMYGVIQDERGISMDESVILGERPLKGSEFDPDSEAYKEAMERIRRHYVASGITRRDTTESEVLLSEGRELLSALDKIGQRWDGEGSDE